MQRSVIDQAIGVTAGQAAQKSGLPIDPAQVVVTAGQAAQKDTEWNVYHA